MSLVYSVPRLALFFRAGPGPRKLKASALGKSVWIVVPPLDFPELAQHLLSLAPTQVSELRQQLRLRGLPVSGTKAMLLERMRGGTPPRERQKPRREDKETAAPWPRLRPKAVGTTRLPGAVRAGLCTHGPKTEEKEGETLEK